MSDINYRVLLSFIYLFFDLCENNHWFIFKHSTLKNVYYAEAVVIIGTLHIKI